MVDALFQSICRVGIFMICAQAVVHFKSKESYEKYLKLLVSVMILIQLFLPLGSLFMGEDRESFAGELEAFRESRAEGMRLAGEQAAEADKILEEMTLRELRERMEEEGGGTQGGEAWEEEDGEAQDREVQGGETQDSGIQDGKAQGGKPQDSGGSDDEVQEETRSKEPQDPGIYGASVSVELEPVEAVEPVEVKTR